MAHSSSGGDFTIHNLDSSTASKDGAIRAILALSNHIFDTSSGPPTHHSSLDEWYRRLSRPDSIVVYATPPPSGSRDPEREGAPNPGDEALGFIFAHAKVDPQLPTRTLHVWLAGTTARARGKGVFAALMKTLEQHARTRGIGTLSVCTFPDTFSNMFAILQKTGWTVQAWLEDGKKVLMSKPV
ncbi:hypothetical protein PV08_10898 [Exophiala spinifera]|uniref:N-acetyltransferase domain-containing protein n=1 Tax=Exophiala spinifera TaxID=91928 RepID=A0A0D1ZF49_9EURO|nr:uncharacterized protein PV08_10898 [Exophiala spinifera]KIW11597.1 hypothetical protein PV08_10898 [Exophiala spinifera]